MTRAVLASVYALRAQVDAIVAQMEDALGVVVPNAAGACPQCGAAEEFVEDASTIGQRASRCTKCGAEWDR